MCFIDKCDFLTDRGYRSVKDLKIKDKLCVNVNDQMILLEIDNIYKIPEYKIIKMVRIMPNAISDGLPTKITYLKPSQYLKLNDKNIKASRLVEQYNCAEYERYNILYMYLISVKTATVEFINEFAFCNGLLVTVYNTQHPLNNRFNKFSSIPKT